MEICSVGLSVTTIRITSETIQTETESETLLLGEINIH